MSEGLPDPIAKTVGHDLCFQRIFLAYFHCFGLKIEDNGKYRAKIEKLG